MLSRKFLIIFLSFLFFGIAIFIGHKYLSDYLLVKRIFAKIDTSLMNQKEREIFKNITTLVKKKNINKVNNIIAINDNDVAIQCTPSKNIYKKDEKIEFKIVIFNKSAKDKVIFPLTSDVLSEAYEKYGFIVTDMALRFDITNARVMKILSRDSEYSETFEFDIPAIGSNKIELSLFTPVIEQIDTHSNIIIKHKLLKRLEITYVAEENRGRVTLGHSTPKR